MWPFHDVMIGNHAESLSLDDGAILELAEPFMYDDVDEIEAVE